MLRGDLPALLAHGHADTSPVTHYLSAEAMQALHAMLATTPPPPQTLWATRGEDEAVQSLREHGEITLPRFDTPEGLALRTSTTLPHVHLGAIRLLHRGVIVVSRTTPTHATWTWNGHRGESVGLRLQRWRTLSYLPYQVGHYALTPADSMSGPLMAAVLVWRYAHTGVTRLDLRLDATAVQDTTSSLAAPDSGWAVEVVEHHHDGSIHRRTVHSATAAEHVEVTRYSFDADDADDFAFALRRNAHPHQQPSPDEGPAERLHPAHEARLLHALVTAPDLYRGAGAITVDLNTWLLHPHPEALANATRDDLTLWTPAPSAVDAVPLDVQDALTILGAPALTIADPEAARRWAATAARVTFKCTGTADGYTHWKHRHIMQATPTGGVALLTPRDRDVAARMDADHLLTALRGAPTTCTVLAGVLDGTDTTSTIRGTLSRLRISSPVTADRLEALHRVTGWLRDPDAWPLPAHKR